MPDFDKLRAVMVDRQIARRGVADPLVLDAMRKIPREAFVPEAMRGEAYCDAPLPIGEGQTISQPFIVACMIEACRLRPGDSVLDIGSGSGYAAAVMAEIAGRVYSIERIPGLAAAAAARLESLGCANVELRCGDGTLGWPEAAPFDAIAAAAAGPAVPGAWKEQLALGGRLVMPVGARGTDQRLLRLTRVSDTAFEEEDLGGVSFVALVGKAGWPT